MELHCFLSDMWRDGEVRYTDKVKGKYLVYCNEVGI